VRVIRLFAERRFVQFFKILLVREDFGDLAAQFEGVLIDDD
jgi:hypothetical protein